MKNVYYVHTNIKNSTMSLVHYNKYHVKLFFFYPLWSWTNNRMWYLTIWQIIKLHIRLVFQMRGKIISSEMQKLTQQLYIHRHKNFLAHYSIWLFQLPGYLSTWNKREHMPWLYLSRIPPKEENNPRFLLRNCSNNSISKWLPPFLGMWVCLMIPNWSGEISIHFSKIRWFKPTCKIS